MSNRTKRKPSRTAVPPTETHTGLWIGVGAAVVVLGALLVAFAFGQNTSSSFEDGDPVVEGAALPPVQPGEDPAVGTPAPVVEGADFDGAPVDIGGGGEPQVVIFLAHWCGHCRAEVPVLQEWIDENGLPDGVEVVSVVTRNDATQANYPPDEWLSEEGWSVPVLVDSDDDEVATAYGLSGTPYYVALDAAGDVAARAEGEIGIEGFEGLIEAARSGGSSESS